SPQTSRRSLPPCPRTGARRSSAASAIRMRGTCHSSPQRSPHHAGWKSATSRRDLCGGSPMQGYQKPKQLPQHAAQHNRQSQRSARREEYWGRAWLQLRRPWDALLAAYGDVRGAFSTGLDSPPRSLGTASDESAERSWSGRRGATATAVTRGSARRQAEANVG